LKGSSRSRYVDMIGEKLDDFDAALLKRRKVRRTGTDTPKRADTNQVSSLS